MATPLRMQSARDDWQTPPWLVDLIHELRPIDLDPCAPGDRSNPTRARNTFTADCPGDVRDWRGHVFINPPFSSRPGERRSQCRDWVIDCTAYARGSEEQRVSLLMPFSARAEQDWHLSALRECSAIWWPRGRLSYIDPVLKIERKGANFPSLMLFFNFDIDDVDRVFSPVGVVTGGGKA